MDTNIIRLAAILDCEGWITLQKISGSRGVGLCLTVGVGNTNPRLAQWLKEKFGGSFYKTKREGPQHKDYWTWRLFGNKAAELLKGCIPYMLLKEEQAILAITFQETMHGKNIYNEPCTPEYVAKMWEFKRRLTLLNRKGKLSPAETDRDNGRAGYIPEAEVTVRTLEESRELSGNNLAQGIA